MRKVKSDDLRPVYKREDLGLGIRGKYLESYKNGSNLVLLSPDVAKVFASEEAVNEALRSLIDVAQRTVNLGKRSKAHAESLSQKAVEHRVRAG